MELGGKAQEPIARSRTFYLGGVGVGDAQHTIAKGPLLIRVHYNLYTTWRSYTSNTLAQLDSNLAARSYDGAQESVCRSSLLMVLNRNIQMLEFVVSKLLHDRFKDWYTRMVGR